MSKRSVEEVTNDEGKSETKIVYREVKRAKFRNLDSDDEDTKIWMKPIEGRKMTRIGSEYQAVIPDLKPRGQPRGGVYYDVSSK